MDGGQDPDSRPRPPSDRGEGAKPGERPPHRSALRAVVRPRDEPARPVPVARAQETPRRAEGRSEAPAAQDDAPARAARPRRLPTRDGAEPTPAKPRAPAPAAAEDQPEPRRGVKQRLRARRTVLPDDPGPQPEPPREQEAPRRERRPKSRATPVDGHSERPQRRPSPRQDPEYAPEEEQPPLPDPPPATARREQHVVDAPDDDAIVENGPIVAPKTVAGRGLMAVIGIMTFVCALLMGAAFIIDRAADAWSGTVLDDVTVTVMPLDGDPVARRLERVAQVLGNQPGVLAVRILPAAETAALLEPWLGSGADLSLLPVPRLVVAERAPGFDPARAARALEPIPGAALDDHAGWSARLEGMAAAIAGGAIAMLALMLCATALCIVFATRAAIATNSATIAVLYALGAEDQFIQRAFQGRFLVIAVRGALMGVGMAFVVFGGLELWSMLSAGAASEQSRALLGAPSIGLVGFAGLLVLGAAIVGLIAFTTAFTVRRQLYSLAP